VQMTQELWNVPGHNLVKNQYFTLLAI